MIETLLKRGVNPQRIAFISMDHPMLKLSSLNDILECYHENIWPNQDAFYFFDEIQYASDWDKWLKTLYDMQPDTRNRSHWFGQPRSDERKYRERSRPVERYTCAYAFFF